MVLVFHFMIPGLPKSPERIKPLGERLWVICVSYWVKIWLQLAGRCLCCCCDSESKVFMLKSYTFAFHTMVIHLLCNLLLIPGNSGDLNIKYFSLYVKLSVKKSSTRNL